MLCLKLVHGQRFSPGTPDSSTTKTGRHDIAEILLKVALNTINQSIKSIIHIIYLCFVDIIIGGIVDHNCLNFLYIIEYVFIVSEYKIYWYTF
jgi:hypothetical protein